MATVQEVVEATCAECGVVDPDHCRECHGELSYIVDSFAGGEHSERWQACSLCAPEPDYDLDPREDR
jgi:hypothetical protein